MTITPHSSTNLLELFDKYKPSLLGIVGTKEGRIFASVLGAIARCYFGGIAACDLAEYIPIGLEDAYLADFKKYRLQIHK